MPFTLSHPAAVLPLRRLAERVRLPLAALVVGAMTPDFEFALHLRPAALWSHSLPGLVGFCLPAGLLALLAWEALARDPVRQLVGLPADAAPCRGWAWWSRAAVAVLLGAATHLLWDGLTHGNYWGARLLPSLRTPAFAVGGRAIPWFSVFQHLSTLAGGAVVLAWLGGELRRAGAFGVVARSPWRRRVLLAAAATAAAAGVWNGLRRGAAGYAGYWGAQLFVGRVAVGAMLGLALALLVYSAARRHVA